MNKKFSFERPPKAKVESRVLPLEGRIITSTSGEEIHYEHDNEDGTFKLALSTVNSGDSIWLWEDDMTDLIALLKAMRKVARAGKAAK